jgi:alanine dehydrogenase
VCRTTTIGVPREIKTLEGRIAVTPAGVRELCNRGHRVMVERGAGEGSGFGDRAFEAEGAVLAGVEELFAEADLIVKVKEPQPEEARRLRPDQVLFTYLHLAAEPELTAILVSSGATCIAYETVEDEHHRLPLLAPMSQIAGVLAAHVAAGTLLRPAGGSGKLIGLIPGVERTRVVVIGGGVAGGYAATTALGMGAIVTVMDTALPRLQDLQMRFGSSLSTVYASEVAIEEQLPTADVVVGAALIHGARAPQLLRRNQLAALRPGSVLVDVSIDQGGCFQTSRPTTHSDPTYEVDGVVHYCVTNMPGAVPVTSTLALTNATFPYVVALAHGVDEALDIKPELKAGVNVRGGEIVHRAVASAMSTAPVEPDHQSLDEDPSGQARAAPASRARVPQVS